VTVAGGNWYEAQSIEGKRIVVTGGTSGIGQATARLLASRGPRVLIVGRDDEGVQEALGDISSAGGEAYGCAADLSLLDEKGKMLRPEDIAPCVYFALRSPIAATSWESRFGRTCR
jgi:NADP-dependent 3-hydroxy acid dehydrogenase YdfG